MANRTRKLISLSSIVAMLASVSLVKCDRASSPVDTGGTDVAMVQVAPPSVVLAVGTQQRVVATVFNASHQVLTTQVSWSTDDPGIATVASDGTVTAVAAGTAHITASSSGKQAAVAVTVTTQSGGGGGSAIVLNPSVRYQTITGWEAVAQAGHENADFQLYKNQLFDIAVNQVGLNRLRVPVRSGSENTQDYYVQWRTGQIDDATWRCVRYATVNDNSDPNNLNTSGFHFSDVDSMVVNVVLPMKQKLEARGEKLFFNLLYVAFTAQICSPYVYNHNNPQEYAEFILAVTLHLKNKYGLTPDAWEVILEPDNTAYWRGKTIGDAIVATAARLKANGFNPTFITPSTTRAYNAVPYFDQLATQVPAALPFMRELSYHRYSAVTDPELQTLAARAQQYGIQTSMLEHIKSDYEDLHSDLKFAQVTAWQQFALAFGSNDDGTQYLLVDRTNPSSPQIKIGSRTKLLRQYFHFIRRGAVRVDAATGAIGIDPLAFVNTDGGYVVVVKADAASSFSVQGLPAGTYGINYSTASSYDVSLPDVTIGSGQLVNASIPQRGVLTIYHK